MADRKKIVTSLQIRWELEVVMGEGGRKRERKGQVIGESEKRMKLKSERAGSVGMIEDWLKRKRDESEKEEGEGGEIKTFQKGRKIQRSPIKAKKEEGNLELILQEIRALRLEGRKDREELEGAVEEMRKEIGEMKEEMRMEEGEWRKERKELRGRLEKLEREMKEREESKGEGRMEGLGGRIERLENKRQENGEERKEEGWWKGRMRELERDMERRKKEKRKRNIIVKGLKGEGERREKVNKLIR